MRTFWPPETITRLSGEGYRCLEHPGQLHEQRVPLRRLLPQGRGASLVADLKGAEGGEDPPDGEELDVFLVDRRVALREPPQRHLG